MPTEGEDLTCFSSPSLGEEVEGKEERHKREGVNTHEVSGLKAYATENTSRLPPKPYSIRASQPPLPQKLGPVGLLPSCSTLTPLMETMRRDAGLSAAGRSPNSQPVGGSYCGPWPAPAPRRAVVERSARGAEAEAEAAAAAIARELEGRRVVLVVAERTREAAALGGRGRMVLRSYCWLRVFSSLSLFLFGACLFFGPCSRMSVEVAVVVGLPTGSGSVDELMDGSMRWSRRLRQGDAASGCHSCTGESGGDRLTWSVTFLGGPKVELRWMSDDW